MTNIIESIYDNTKDGVPNYSIILIDGRRLYSRGEILDPMPSTGDAIDYTTINTKTSAQGNQYTNIKDVQLSVAPDETGNYQTKQVISKPPTNIMGKNNTQRLDIFVTGVVGRSMGSGHFAVQDIAELTKNAVIAFNENLKEL